MSSDASGDVAALLARIAIFSDLPLDVLETVAASLQMVHLEPGQTLFSQGDDSDGLYLVLSGRVRVYVAAREEDDRSQDDYLQELGRGQIFGEVSLVTSTPRTATVRAARETTVLRLSPDVFATVVDQHPGLAMRLAGILADRLLSVDRRDLTPAGCRTMRLHLATDVGTGDRFLSDFVASAERLGRSLVVRAKDRPDGAIGDLHQGGVAARLTSWLHGLEERFEHVVLLTDHADQVWNDWCTREADIFVDVRARGERSVQAGGAGGPWVMRHEVVLHPRGASRPGGATSGWPGRVHHVREGSRLDIERLVRVLTDRAHGVVLSGGGARGFAHLGVIKALEEIGHPIDVIGGTSIGAVAAALVAAGYGHEQRFEIMTRALKRRRSVFPLTLPVLSIASDRKVDALLGDMFGSMLIEDLWIGFFCVSANLTRAATVIHEKGPLAPALRATFSLPGVLPPVVKDGDLLIDGGVMNNLPVDVMRRFVGHGEITAVDLRPIVDLRMAETEGRIPDWRVLAGNISGRADHPTVIDVLMRTVELGSAQAQRINLEAAAVTHLLRPPVQDVRLSDFEAGSALIDLGYRYAVEQLS